MIPDWHQINWPTISKTKRLLLITEYYIQLFSFVKLYIIFEFLTQPYVDTFIELLLKNVIKIL